jgi:hypothetical protein
MLKNWEWELGGVMKMEKKEMKAYFYNISLLKKFVWKYRSVFALRGSSLVLTRILRKKLAGML